MVTICLQCGDEGFPNAFVYCVKCLNFAVHRYCLHKLPKTFDEFVWWVCEDCEVESMGFAHQKSGAEEGVGTGSEHSIINSKAKSNKNSITCLATGIEMGHGENGPLLQSAYEKFDLREDSQLVGECLPSRVNLKADNDSNLLVVVAKEQGCQIGSSQQNYEPQGVEVVADSSPLREEPITLVGGSSRPKGMGESSKKKKGKNRVTAQKDENKAVCFHCKKEGHWRRNCNEYLALVKQQKKKNDISSSASRKEKQRLESRIAKQTHEARMPLNSAGNEREADPRKREVLVHTRSDVNYEISQLPMGGQPSIAIVDCLARAQPLINPIWRGSFNILNNDDDALEGFVAHLSSRACQKVYEEASVLPSLLRLEMLPKAEVWPKSFEKSEPTDDNIALYIFPADRRYESTFDKLVEEMTRREFAMRASVKNAELLIFTSTELPLLYWRFQNKYYLWGVFRGKQSSSSHAVNKHMFPNPVQDRSSETGKLLSYANNIGTRFENSLLKTFDAKSPLSPLCNSGSFVSRNF